MLIDPLELDVEEHQSKNVKFKPRMHFFFLLCEILKLNLSTRFQMLLYPSIGSKLSQEVTLLYPQEDVEESLKPIKKNEYI